MEKLRSAFASESTSSQPSGEETVFNQLQVMKGVLVKKVFI